MKKKVSIIFSVLIDLLSNSGNWLFWHRLMGNLQDSQPIPRRLHQLTASLEHWYYSHHKPEVHRNHPNKYIIIYTMYICQNQAKLYVVNYYFLYMSEHERKFYLKVNPSQNIGNKDLTFCSCSHIDGSMISILYMSKWVLDMYSLPCGQVLTIDF